MSRSGRPPNPGPDPGIGDTWRAYFSERCHPDVAALVEAYPDRRSLYVDLVDLYGYDSAFTEAFFDSPARYVRLAAEVLCAGYDALEHVNVRVVNNPAMFQLDTLGARHVHELVTVEGVADSVGDVGATVAVAIYECRCGNRVGVRPGGLRLTAPRHCGECGSATGFVFRPERSTFVDLRRVSLLASGTAERDRPTRPFDVYLADDLVDAVDSGETFLVTGIVQPERVGSANRFRLCLDGLAVTEERTGVVDRSLAEVIQSRWESTTGE